MSWRNHRTDAEETRAVKAALKERGIPVKWIKHGRGTASGWLKINLGANAKADYRSLRAQVLAIVKQVTGRRGEYDGEILILAQDD